MSKDEDVLKQVKTMERFGINYDSPGVDPENVPAFAKILRLIGVILVAAFVLWGLLYDWSHSRSPFEQLLKEFGARGRHRNVWSYELAGAFSIVGWYFRFYIGTLFASIFFLITRLLCKIFKSV